MLVDFLQKSWVGTRDANVQYDTANGTREGYDVFSPDHPGVLCFYRAVKPGIGEQSPRFEVALHPGAFPAKPGDDDAQNWRIEGVDVSVRGGARIGWQETGGLAFVADVDGLSGILKVPTPKGWVQNQRTAPPVTEADIQGAGKALIHALQQIAQRR